MSIIEHDALETVREIRDLPETSEPKTREQVLLEAAEIVETVGYVHGIVGMHDPAEGRGVCILGAVARAAGLALFDMGGYSIYAMDAAARFLGVPYDRAYRWNDHLAYERKRTRAILGRTVPPAERVATCLRLVADGYSFEEASARS